MLSSIKVEMLSPYQRAFCLTKVFLPTNPRTRVSSNGSWKQQVTCVRWLCNCSDCQNVEELMLLVVCAPPFLWDSRSRVERDWAWIAVWYLNNARGLCRNGHLPPGKVALCDQSSPGSGTCPANAEGAEKKRGSGGAQEDVLRVFHYSARLVDSKMPMASL